MTTIFNDTKTALSRRDSESEKWNAYADDVIPMWVADSDYAVPDSVVDALKSRLNHPIFGYGSGYGQVSQKFSEIIAKRMKDKYDWHIKPQWVCLVPGVVPGLNSCRAIMGDVGSKAITALPAYPHLKNPTPALARPMQFFNMVNIDGRYTPDFDELEANITADTKMLMLGNPHNPVGTIYNDSELKRFAEIAEKHDLLICSDDIHADFPLYDDIPYRPLAVAEPAVSKRTITLMAASKTYNIAGLNCAFAIIEDDDLRNRFSTQLKGLVGGVNILGIIASEAAYEHGDDWLKEQIVHLRGNAEYCHTRINQMPYIHMNKMEATYLAWIDAHELSQKLRDKGEKNAHDYFVKYGVAVSDGVPFGDGNFFRINLATTRELLTQGLDRIEQAIKAL